MNYFKKAIAALLLIFCMGLYGCGEEKKQDMEPTSTALQEIITVPTCLNENIKVILPEVDADALEGFVASSGKHKKEESIVVEETTVPEERQSDVQRENEGITLPEVPMDDVDSAGNGSETYPSEKNVDTGAVMEPNKDATEISSKNTDETSVYSDAKLPGASAEDENKEDGKIVGTGGDQERTDSDGTIEMPEIIFNDENE